MIPSIRYHMYLCQRKGGALTAKQRKRDLKKYNQWKKRCTKKSD